MGEEGPPASGGIVARSWGVACVCPPSSEPPSIPSMSTQPPGPLAFGLHSATCWLLSPCPDRDQDSISVCPPCLCLVQRSTCDCPDAFPLSPPGHSRHSKGRPSVPEVGLSIFLPCAPLSTQVDIVVYLFYLPLYRPSPPFWPMEHSRWSHLLVTQAWA